MNEAFSDLLTIKTNNINPDRYNRTKNSLFGEVIRRTDEQIKDAEVNDQKVTEKIKFQNGLSQNGIEKIMDNFAEAYVGQISTANMFKLSEYDFVENTMKRISKAEIVTKINS
jgi:hypothetical protein